MIEPSRIIHGDALEELRKLPENSIDAIVTDPPSGISFMNKSWDSNKGGRDKWIAWLAEVMTECLRCLKPGGHALIWALPRTSHWTATALEDAGFQIRDCITHLYGTDTIVNNFLASLTEEQAQCLEQILSSEAPSIFQQIFGSGFPKSLDVSKAIDKHLKAEREVIGKRTDGRYAYDFSPASQKSGGIMGNPGKETKQGGIITAPSTPEAQQWQGYGTALKPASEHWILCRKPLSEKSIAENVLKHGTGGLNIAASRIQSTGHEPNARDNKHPSTSEHKAFFGNVKGIDQSWDGTQGRFPSNLLLSHSILCEYQGVKRVRGNNSKVDTAIPRKVKGLFSPNATETQGYGYADSEGMEEVEAWECSDDCPVRLLDLQSGIRKTGAKTKLSTIGYGRAENHAIERANNSGEPSEGGASRYFKQFHPLDDYAPFLYQSKPSRAERNRGCEGLPEKEAKSIRRLGMLADLRIESEQVRQPESNNHPTVKSVALLKYLIAMVTPEGGTVLDCFAGSGTTGVACAELGHPSILIEQEESYVNIIKARIAHAEGQAVDTSPEPLSALWEVTSR